MGEEGNKSKLAEEIKSRLENYERLTIQDIKHLKSCSDILDKVSNATKLLAALVALMDFMLGSHVVKHFSSQELWEKILECVGLLIVTALGVGALQVSRIAKGSKVIVDNIIKKGYVDEEDLKRIK